MATKVSATSLELFCKLLVSGLFLVYPFLFNCYNYFYPGNIIDKRLPIPMRDVDTVAPVLIADRLIPKVG
jgi:hypothetical protein